MKYKDKKNNEINVDEKYNFIKETVGYKRFSKLKSKFMNPKISNIEKYAIYCRLSDVDPDSHSIVLQKIYKDKWNEKYLNVCKCGEKKYYSDAMTSLQGLLNHFYENICKDEWEAYKKEHPKVRHFSKAAMKEIIDNINDYPKFKKYFVDDPIITDFIEYYHTIGNYIPVPQYFNTNRSGNYADHDMWDLTLTKIYDYYHIKKEDSDISNSDNVLMELLFCDEKVLYTKMWLDKFSNWKTFIRENYLQDYVNVKTGMIKKEFTDIHNWNKTYPDNESDYLKYFKLLVDTIKSRSKHIINNEKIDISDANEIR